MRSCDPRSPPSARANAVAGGKKPVEKLVAELGTYTRNAHDTQSVQRRPFRPVRNIIGARKAPLWAGRVPAGRDASPAFFFKTF